MMLTLQVESQKLLLKFLVSSDSSSDLVADPQIVCFSPKCNGFS